MIEGSDPAIQRKTRIAALELDTFVYPLGDLCRTREGSSRCRLWGQSQASPGEVKSLGDVFVFGIIDPRAIRSGGEVKGNSVSCLSDSNIPANYCSLIMLLLYLIRKC